MNARAVLVRAATIEAVRQAPVSAQARERAVTIGPVKVSDITMPADLAVDCDDVGAGYYVHLPVAGRMESRYRGTEVVANRERAVVYQPGGGRIYGRWAGQSRVLCVQLDGAAVGTALARLPGGRPAAGASFEPALDARRGPGRTWVEQLLVLCRQPAGQDGLLAHPLVARPLAESLVNGFLLAAGHTCSAAIAAAAADTEPTRPAVIQKAIELMEEEPQAPLNVADLATSCGVSPRALQLGFQRHVGLSPMAYLRDVRLRRADAELRGPAPHDTVALVARRWGFVHLGRFAASYEARFGQPPSQTLRAAR